jgi:hypothetical protein
MFMGKGFPNPAFQPPPALFNTVEVWGIGWEVNNLTACGLNQLNNPATVVKGGIIENQLMECPDETALLNSSMILQKIGRGCNTYRKRFIPEISNAHSRDPASGWRIG